MDEGLDVCLLGWPEVRWVRAGQRQTLTFPSLKSLYYLLVTRRPVARERLMALLWPDVPPKRAQTSLRTALYQLQRTLPEGALHADRRCVMLADRYPGPGPLSGRLPGGFPHCRGVRVRPLAFSPWREDFHARLMETLAWQGRVAAALKHYETCRMVLQQEVGLSPGPPLQHLVRRLRALHDRPPVFRVPPLPGPLVGREEEMARLSQALQATRFVVLVGPGGVGKTHLMLAFAHRHRRCWT